MVSVHDTMSIHLVELRLAVVVTGIGHAEPVVTRLVVWIGYPVEDSNWQNSCNLLYLLAESLQLD